MASAEIAIQKSFQNTQGMEKIHTQYIGAQMMAERYLFEIMS